MYELKTCNQPKRNKSYIYIYIYVYVYVYIWNDIEYSKDSVIILPK